MAKKDEIKLIAAKSFEINSNNYLLADFLNKSLKKYNLIFGLTRKEGNDIITIYETINCDSIEK